MSAKICVSCGQDVAGRRRTKDDEGNYWCAGCFVRKARENEPSIIDLVPEVAHGSTTPCPSCGAQLGEHAVLCTSCGHDRRTGASLETTARDRTAGVVALEAATASAVGTSVVLTSVIGAAIGGIVGAAIWAFVAWTFSVEISWIAILVGILAGGGAFIGARGRAGVLTGVLAALVALASLVGGRVFVIVGDLDLLASEAVDDEMAIEALAAAIQDEAGTSGFGMWFRRGGFATVYPAMEWDDAVREARQLWYDEMTQFDRDEALLILEEEVDLVLGDRAAATREGLEHSFHVIDILFALVAVAAAYGVGSGSSGSDEEE